MWENADLESMFSNAPSIYVDSALQKAFIEVNEEGTEGSAAMCEYFCNRNFFRYFLSSFYEQFNT